MKLLTMRLSVDLAIFLRGYLLCGVMTTVAVEIKQSRHGSYGLCRIYSYNVQLRPGTNHADERHFFVCCTDAGNELNCHEQTLQSPRRSEGA